MLDVTDVQPPDAADAGSTLPDVELFFASEGHDEDLWHVTHASIVEELSALYECRLDLLTTDPDITPSQLVGRRATLRVVRAGLERRFHGVVRRVECRRRFVDDRAAVQLVLVPALWLLSRRTNSRVFHQADALAIVRRVLDDAGLYAGDALEVHALDPATRSYKPREYCVQYRETDLDFVRRLLEDEGLAFYFAHDAAASERVVVVDGALASLSSTYADVPTVDGRRQVRLLPGGYRLLLPYESVESLARTDEVHATGVVLRDFDFTNALNSAAVTAERPRGAAPSALTAYEYPGAYTFVDLDDPRLATALGVRRPAPPADALPQCDEHSGARAADVRYEELRARDSVYAGQSNVTGMAAGRVFFLDDANAGDAEQDYLVTRVEHEIDGPHDVLATARPSGSAQAERYRNRFACLPRATTFRPARRTPRPAIHGVQTATVVGRSGDEVLTDPYGRVKVQFHWDREHTCERNDRHHYAAAVDGPTSDPERLCWVRVAQAWAGAGFGAMFIPRVGMEVVVSFLDGDPDRPLVVGCVYNNANPPPYDLPAHATVSTLQTRTTPASDGAPGFNELRFEDAAGAEEVFVHAQRDLNEVVRRNHTARIDADEEIVVGANQSTSVAHSQRTSVTHDRVVAVGGDHTETVVGSQTTTIEGARTETVVRDETVTIHGHRTHTIDGGETVVIVGGSSVVVHPKAPPRPGAAPDEDDPDAGKFANHCAVHGNRLTEIHGREQVEVKDRLTHVERHEELRVEKEYVVNVGGYANLLVGDIAKPATMTTGYFISPAEVRLGGRSDALKELTLMRENDKLEFSPERVTLEASARDVVISIAGTENKIRIAGDGKTVEIIAGETLTLRAGKDKITLGAGIELSAGGGTISLKGGTQP
jgi:type VI secretion system secreted protein VgrG